MRTWLISCVLLSCVSAVHAQTAPANGAAVITHVPLNEAIVGPLSITFDVRDPQLAGAITLHLVRDGKPVEGARVTAERDGTGYAAVIPEVEVRPPGFSYYVTEHMPDGSERAVFASAAAPHPVRVTYSEAVEDERERLHARAGQRSTWLVSADVVDYGDRSLPGATAKLHDRYYRLEAGYAYAFLTQVEAIRLSIVRVRGEAAVAAAASSFMQALPGIDFGRAEITLQPMEWLRLRSAVSLGASQRGFEYGGGGAILLGDPYDVNLDLSVESMTTLGTTAGLRFGFRAHPRVPMGASVEVSSFPLGDDAGVRLLYDVGYRFGPVTRLMLRAGYQGRTSVSGGPALGASFDYGF